MSELKSVRAANGSRRLAEREFGSAASGLGTGEAAVPIGRRHSRRPRAGGEKVERREVIPERKAVRKHMRAEAGHVISIQPGTYTPR